MKLEKTFVVERICQVCEKKMRAVKMRSRMKVLSTDEDGFTYYEGYFNPCYYTVWICEHCGFAADEKTFMTRMPKRHLNILRNVLLVRNIKIPFTEKRTIENGMTSLRLALKYQDIIKGKASKKARFAHQMAWLYREDGDRELEEIFLKKAAAFYKEALATETFPTESLTECTIHYLLAAIYRRIGEPNEAIEYLSKIVNNPSARNQDYNSYEKAKVLWEKMHTAKQK